MDASAGRIQREFADRDAHTLGAEVAKPENPLAIGNHNDPGFLVRPVLQNFPNMAAIMYGDIEAPRLAENMLELLARLAHCRRVNKRHHLFNIMHHDPVEEGFITVLQCNQVKIAFQVGRLVADIAQHA